MKRDRKRLYISSLIVICQNHRDISEMGVAEYKWDITHLQLALRSAASRACEKTVTMTGVTPVTCQIYHCLLTWHFLVSHTVSLSQSGHCHICNKGTYDIGGWRSNNVIAKLVLNYINCVIGNCYIG